jgi:hypothetical protein
MKKAFIPLLALIVLAGVLTAAGNYNWSGGMAGNLVNPPLAKDELKKLYAVYANPDSSLYTKGMVRLYDGEKNNKIMEEMAFSYLKKKKQFISQLGALQSLMGNSLFVQVDTVEKYIMVSKVKDTAKAPVEIGVPYEKFLRDTAAFKIELVLTGKKTERSISIRSELNPEIKSSIVYYDTTTYKIRRMETIWWKDGVVYNDTASQKKTWLSVMDYTYSPVPATLVEDAIRRYITINAQGKAEATPAFLSYDLRSSF